MTYQVLARKWRPKDFASLVGQEHVVRALTHALEQQRLHHAYLFTGTRGVGKTTLSRILAKALNCETGITAAPCGVCGACRAIDEGRFVDYVEMDAASNRGVDEMAALLERAVYAPVDARFKVYMIDEVHMLTNHAFNAMLKTLEEPPAHVKFILATTDPQKIPVTVLSRCLQFNLKQMPATHIVSHLEKILAEEGVACQPQALRLLARAADGSMRDALSLTDQAIAYAAGDVTEQAVRGMLGALDQSYLMRLLEALAAGDGEAVLAVADEMASRSLSFSTALQDLAGLLHRIAWAQAAPGSVIDEWPEALDIRRFAGTLAAEEIQLYYQIAITGRAELGLAPDAYAGFTMTLLRMLAFRPAVAGAGPATPTVPAASAAGRGPGDGAARVSAAVDAAPRQAPTPAAQPGLPAAVEPAASAPETSLGARGTAASAPRSPDGPASAMLQMLRGANSRGAAARSEATRAPVSRAPAATPTAVPTAAPAAAEPIDAAACSAQGDAQVPPWEDMPLDDYVPYHGARDEAFAMQPDPERAPLLEASPEPAPAAPPPQAPLAPAISLAPLGFDGDWPALAVTLALKGISYQLAFSSELIALEATVLTLRVPVPQYAEGGQVAKLQAAVSEKLGKQLDVQVEIGPAGRTAAAADAAARAQRQQQAERSIAQDPFVQSLIREFDATIVPGSVRPLPPPATGRGAPPVANF